ncbi:hypothetical protein IFM89_032699 [Coptis chinensis]|uniref:Neprosin PEP catalytic domain-containing protein n=1 Tax=Coptis chinensis TaxID=261450 RepID=A0A835IH09_9MAGN|nr:hypothetical protein IFM89_032699 [Coptis chinensis]
MALKFWITLTLVALLICLSYHGIEGRTVSTREEDHELEEQLNILNKPAIKSFEDEIGDMFDCIDINKQPAFDHPLLKDHKIQMKPTMIPEGVVSQTSSQRKRLVIMPKGIDCPEGTVPIRRTQKEDLLRAKSFMESSSIHTLNNDSPGQYSATFQSSTGGETRYYGAQANMNVINPRVADDQASLALIWLRSATDDNVIQAGWAGAKPGCFNLHCSGFVRVDWKNSIDTVFDKTSVYDYQQLEMQLRVIQDQRKNWWVQIPDFNISFGYWPGSLFQGLADGASQVGFGGITRGSVDGINPVMGFGTFPPVNAKRCGYFRQMKIVNKDNQLTRLVGDWKENTDSPKCYGVKSYGYRKDNGDIIEYGGPGGRC